MLQCIRKNFNIRDNELADIPLIIACSSRNRFVVEKYMKDKNYYRFDVDKIRFVQVADHPLLDTNGKLCLSFEYKVI